MPRTDVLVVGAGPAGATAAFHLARAGLTTRLIDRKPFPRPKVCGDGLSPRALRALDRMGLVDATLTASRIVGLRLVGKRGVTTYGLADQPLPFNFGAVVSRTVLDDRIRRAAAAAGAELVADTSAIDVERDGVGRVRGVWVDGPRGRELLEADLTIVADGASGRIGRQLRGDVPNGPYSAFALRQYWAGVRGCEPFFEFHLPLRFEGRDLVGYGWVFPMGEDRVNVGIGVLAEHARAEARRFPEVLARFLDDLTARDPRFAAATPVGPVEAGPVNSRMCDPGTVPAGALLVGDAGGLVNPFTAEGIGYALESGELAARAAVGALARKRSVGVAYERALVSALPRHWATRQSARHFRWLMGIAPDLLNAARTTELVRAMRQVALDLPAPPVARPSSGPAHWLHASARHRAVDLVRGTDALLAEVVDALLASPTSVATAPLAVASAIAAGARANGAVVVDGLAAVTLLSLAHALLDEVDDGAGEHDVTTAAIVLADCVTTEAVTVLARLSASTYRLVVEAFQDAARARVALAGVSGDAASIGNGDRPRSIASSERATWAADHERAVWIAARYVALGAPAREAATLVLEAGARGAEHSHAAVARFATWYAALRMATMDTQRQRPAVDAPVLRALLAAAPGCPPGFAETQTLAAELLAAARALDPVAGAATAATAS